MLYSEYSASIESVTVGLGGTPSVLSSELYMSLSHCEQLSGFTEHTKGECVCESPLCVV